MPSPEQESREQRESPKPPPAETKAAKPENPLHDDEEWDAVDEAAWESFPASDPPSHWAGADHPATEDEGEAKR